jgi:lactate permease
VLGAVTGFFPIGWIVLNVIFLYRLTVEKGVFETLQTTIGGVTTDRRLQLLLIAFAFGAFFEGASGFGTPVAVTGAILIGLGFSPLAASGLSLIANTAPVAYGALGTPIAGLAPWATWNYPVPELHNMITKVPPIVARPTPEGAVFSFT